MPRVLRFLSPQERAKAFPGIKRLFYQSDAVNEPYEKGRPIDAPRLADEAAANLVGSQTDVAGIHMPVLDIDVPASLVPSSTEGHFHLYLDVPLTWYEYSDLLYALSKAGILEPGYVEASVNKGGSFVRKPGVTKKEVP